MQSTPGVIIKGVREGLLIILDDQAPFPQILSELSERISAQPGFFKGAGVTLNSGRRIIDRPEFDVIYKMLTRNEMRVHTFVSTSAQSRMIAESFGVTGRPPSFAAGDAGDSLAARSRAALSPDRGYSGAAAEAGTGLFLRCSLRPGQTVRFAGDVCVLGNVEVGAEVVADGDVVIWGELNGTVHAGALGDDEAVVCALKLSPVQVAIAGIVSRFPGHMEAGPGDYLPPEMARIEGGRIVVEAWRAEEYASPEGAPESGP